MRPAGKQIFRGSMEDPEGSYRKKKRDWERHAKGESRHRSPMAQRALIWQIYKAVEIDGFAIAKVAEQLEISDSQCRAYYRKARYAIKTSDEFDHESANIRKEMLKFLPLATTALQQNLMDAEPRVTVAYLQGVGALINRDEIDVITDADRAAQQQRSIHAMNPRMRAALGITEVPPSDVVITTKGETDEDNSD